MKPVNLLPERHRPRTATGDRKGSAYVLLALLGVVLVGVLTYVMTLNSVNSDKDKIAQLKVETQRNNAQADQLGAYGDFAKIKQQRVAAVAQAANGRIDWERLVLELAHVLPDGVWLTKSSAVDGSGASLGAGAAPPPAAASGAPGASSAPTLSLTGCALDQAHVAVALVRLRELQGATDVHLAQSSRPDDAVPGASGGSSTAGAGSGDCGATKGNPNYSFQADVTFKAQASTNTAPKALGGGS